MKFTDEIDEMAAEYDAVVVSIKAVDALLSEEMYDGLRVKLNKMKAARELERDQLEILMTDYFLYIPIDLILEHIYGTPSN